MIAWKIGCREVYPSRVIKELKDKVRTLCLQPQPSDSLIRLALHELAGQEDTEMYEELTRQANRHRAKLDISYLCLLVLTGESDRCYHSGNIKVYEGCKNWSEEGFGTKIWGLSPPQLVWLFLSSRISVSMPFVLPVCTYRK